MQYKHSGATIRCVALIIAIEDYKALCDEHMPGYTPTSLYEFALALPTWVETTRVLWQYPFEVPEGTSGEMILQIGRGLLFSNDWSSDCTVSWVGISGDL
jgi:hypothetical protein